MIEHQPMIQMREWRSCNAFRKWRRKRRQSASTTGPHPVGERCERKVEEVAEVRDPLASVQVVEGNLDDAVVLVLPPARDAPLCCVRQEVPPNALRCAMTKMYVTICCSQYMQQN